MLNSYADEEFKYSAGLRVWSDTWQGNSFININGKPVAAHYDSSSTSVAIPFINIKYKDYGISASRSLPSQFSLSDGVNSSSINRSETDLNFLYYILPNFSASVGYKVVEWSGLQNKGPIFAISASAPISSGWGIYGSAGLGSWTTNVPNTGKLNSAYSIGEFGLSYSIGTNTSFIKTSTITFGNRYQKITAKNAPFANYRDATDTTSGPVVGFIGSF